MIYEIRNNGLELVINNGTKYQNYSQRKNQYKYESNKLIFNGYTSCQVSSMIHCLEICGFKFPSGFYQRPPDNLAKFIMENNQIDSEYKKNFRALYDAYKKGEKDSYTPMEIHRLLSMGVNLWLKTTATYFKENSNIYDDILRELIVANKPVVISGNIKSGNSTFGHVVSLVGVIYSLEDSFIKKTFKLNSWDKDTTQETNQFIYNLLENFINNRVSPQKVIIDDSYGHTPSKSNNFAPYSPNSIGEDVILEWDEFIDYFKPIKDKLVKMAHFFNNGLAVS